MNLVIIFFIAISSAGLMEGKELNWQNLTEETFTAEHNWEMVKAHVRDNAQLLKLISKGIFDRRDISLDETIFTLYTRDGNPNGVRIYLDNADSLKQGKFNAKKPVIFVTHGFLSGGTVDWMIQMKTAQLEALDCNYISIDWSECAGTILYPSAKSCTTTVAKYLSDIINFLGQQGADVSGMHLLGHSLGAHIMGQVSQNGIQVGRITGWDPAGVLYSSGDLVSRLDPSDADVVDVIHTCRSELGYNGLLGDYDFFPNGGTNQPGCSINFMCDHSMSYFYYLQSLYYTDKYPGKWCSSFDEAISGKCTGETNFMGVLSVNGKPGSYYLKVGEAATGNP